MNITELCLSCKQNNSCTMCWKTSNKKCPHFIQKTNADRIRAMSDEELAEFIRDVSYQCQSAFCGDHCPMCAYPWCSCERTMEWLQQPNEEE